MGIEYDFAKVLDFGLVKILDETETQITAEGATTGTPAYMAPEIALGNTRIDGRADLYSLGCVAYWLLTGKPCFRGEWGYSHDLGPCAKSPRATINQK